MPNENNKINELTGTHASGSDVLAELETLTVRHFRGGGGTAPLEADDVTFTVDEGARNPALDDIAVHLNAELRARAALIEQLRYDLEQSRARCQGLGRELEAREEIAASLDAELREARDALANVREPDLALQKAHATARTLGDERSALLAELEVARAAVEAMSERLAAAESAAAAAKDALAVAGVAHAKELRQLRFELGEARETLAETSQVTEQLAGDLARQRTDRQRLEDEFGERESRSEHRLARLEAELAHRDSTIADYERKLATKSEAINALMDELARREQQPAGTAVDESVVLATQASPDEGAPGCDEPGERVTRLLVGRIASQELRFPLFKPRLTIGREKNNDISLNAPFISRRHALILTADGAARIVDRDSKNGVYVNSTRVSDRVLRSGDRVAIGSIEFRYEEILRRDSA